jgi:hypothetical protein
MDGAFMRAAEALRAARTAGVAVGVEGKDLVLQASAPPSQELLGVLSELKPEIIQLLRRERHPFLDPATDSDARAGWVRARIGTLSPSRVPHHWPAARWPQFVVDADSFCRDWLEKAFVLGWPIWELFGCHCRAPWGRIQGMGLVLLLQGHEIAALTATEAVIRTSTGAHQAYRRKPADPLHPAERCLVWELQDER